MDITKKDYALIFFIFGGFIVLIPLYILLFYKNRELFWTLILIVRLITYGFEIKGNYLEKILHKSLENNNHKLISFIISSIIISLGGLVFTYFRFKVLFWVFIMIEFIDAFVITTINILKKLIRTKYTLS